MDDDIVKNSSSDFSIIANYRGTQITDYVPVDLSRNFNPSKRFIINVDFLLGRLPDRISPMVCFYTNDRNLVIQCLLDSMGYLGILISDSANAANYKVINFNEPVDVGYRNAFVLNYDSGRLQYSFKNQTEDINFYPLDIDCQNCAINDFISNKYNNIFEFIMVNVRN